mmetsp:Transcript_13651/g.31443  ORF Transcript_13651/g.31443 Transcript_13651/m.31443 type:complete len:89 (-) Transcript_13651:401-667(-)
MKIVDKQSKYLKRDQASMYPKEIIGRSFHVPVRHVQCIKDLQSQKFRENIVEQFDCNLAMFKTKLLQLFDYIHIPALSSSVLSIRSRC